MEGGEFVGEFDGIEYHYWHGGEITVRKGEGKWVEEEDDAHELAHELAHEGEGKWEEEEEEGEGEEEEGKEEGGEEEKGWREGREFVEEEAQGEVCVPKEPYACQKSPKKSPNSRKRDQLLMITAHLTGREGEDG